MSKLVDKYSGFILDDITDLIDVDDDGEVTISKKLEKSIKYSLIEFAQELLNLIDDFVDKELKISGD